MGRLDDYIQVNERIVSATPDELAPIQSVDTDAPAMLTETMGYIRATVILADGRRAYGTASFDLSLSGKSAQATNPIEDCETSAVGRALAFLGYHAQRSIASREEVQEARRRAGDRRAGADGPTEKQNDFFHKLLRSSVWTERERAAMGAKFQTLTKDQARDFIDQTKAVLEERKAARAGGAEVPAQGVADGSPDDPALSYA